MKKLILFFLTLVLLTSGSPLKAAYDGNTGRWMERDPIQERGGINLYRYVNNDPLNSIDPSGLLNRGLLRWSIKAGGVIDLAGGGPADVAGDGISLTEIVIVGGLAFLLPGDTPAPTPSHTDPAPTPPAPSPQTNPTQTVPAPAPRVCPTNGPDDPDYHLMPQDEFPPDPSDKKALEDFVDCARKAQARGLELYSQAWKNSVNECMRDRGYLYFNVDYTTIF